MTEKVIGLASTSRRRAAALEQIPEVRVIKSPGGEENGGSLETIALDKIRVAEPIIQAICEKDDCRLDGVVAADANTYIAIFGPKGEKLVPKGKPSVPQTTYRHFQSMSRRAARDGDGYYEVHSASAFVDPSKKEHSEREGTRVVLHLEKINRLATKEGFLEYMMEFADFYSSEAYSSHGLQSLRMEDLSGGISLPVLAKMGAVKMIDGVEIAKVPYSEAELILKQALLNVAIGFSPKILNKIHPDAMAFLLGWSWTNNVVNSILSK